MNKFFTHKGFMVGEIINLASKEAYDACHAGAVLLDIREAYLNRVKKFDVPFLEQIPYSIFKSKISGLNKNATYICADSAGLKSKDACTALKNNGFTNVANLAGGLVEWEKDGFPIIVDKKERLSGSCMCQLKPREKLKGFNHH